MSVDPRLLIHVQLQMADEQSGCAEKSTVLRIDMIRKVDLFGVRLSERDHRFMIDSHRITFSGQSRKAGALFRALEPEGQLRNQLMNVHRAWTHDDGGLVSACEGVCETLSKLPGVDWP